MTQKIIKKLRFCVIKLIDVDFDESVTVSDALMALNHASGNTTLTGDAFLAADVDGDGDVDITDAQLILSYAAHSIDHFPIEE